MEKLEQVVEEKVAIRFKFRMDDGTEFVDALNVSRAEFAALSQKDIDAQQLARAEKFRDYMASQTPQPVPTVAEALDPVTAGDRIKNLSEESTSIDAQLQTLMARRSEIMSQLQEIIPPDVLEG